MTREIKAKRWEAGGRLGGGGGMGELRGGKGGWAQRCDRGCGHWSRCVGRLIADAQALLPVSVVCV